MTSVRRPAGWLAVALALVLTGVGVANPRPQPAPGSQPAPRAQPVAGRQPAPPLLPLHLARPAGATPVVADNAGRQVLLRGINVNALGQYAAVDRRLPTVVPLTEAQVAAIAADGFDSVRLLVSWSRLEPRRGAFDAAYVAQVRQAVGWFGRHGMYVVLDMHQDAWGVAVGAGPHETCPPGLDPAIGWDGAPAWATLSDGLPHCQARQRELSPAVVQAWQSFWLDRDGVQTELVRTWGRLAQAFAADPTVAGYDLLNEPNPGYLPYATDATSLGSYYQRALAAIRTGERSARHGFAHLGFLEPMVTFDVAPVADGPLPGLVAPVGVTDTQVVYAPHIYTGSLSADKAATGQAVIPISAAHDEAAREAARLGTTYWSGEWGFFGNAAGNGALARDYARAEDAHLVGGAWWDWVQACGDPHQFYRAGVPGLPASDGLNRLACPGGTSLGVNPAFAAVLSRPFPRAAPGVLTSLASDPTSHRLSLAGVGRGTLEVWFPGVRPPRVTGHGLGAAAVRAVPGGFLVTARTSGSYTLAAQSG